MDKNTFQDNLKTLKELILDEEKLVTYISLSKDLCIHVNEAKKLLNHVIKEIRESEPEIIINVCYIICGLLNDNSACTTVCTEAEIEILKEKFKNIFYKHVYCISRAVLGVDNVALAIINKLEDFSLCMGQIKANSCIMRTDDEIGYLKSSSYHTVVIESKSKLNDLSKKATDEKSKPTSSTPITTVQIKPEPVTKSKTPSPKKDLSANKNNTNKNLSKNTKPTKGIVGFFNKINGESSKIKSNKLKQENVENDEKVKVETKVKVKPCSSEILSDKMKKEEPVNKSKYISDNSALKKIKQNAKIDKKRKRVLHVSDSESETETADPFADNDSKMAVDHESEDEIPPTPTVNTVKITSGIVNPKKRRKVIDKTYTGEDGYILTKKEEVYESCSDNEEEVITNFKKEKENVEQVIQVKIESPQKAKGKSKKKISPPQKGKQQMMTNFFKKV